MAAEHTRVINIFYCYARKDKALRDELENHLEVLRRSGQIILWCDREIQAGAEWKREIDLHLNTADIILLLVSPSFMHSDYCYSIEMRRALERHRAREARIIPIILRPVDWEGTPISDLQALPRDGKPITKWSNRDEAFRDVAKGIGEVVSTLQAEKLNLCPECGRENMSHMIFCDECGGYLNLCPVCKRTNVVIARLCEQCGQPLK